MTASQNILAFIHEVAIFFPVYLLLFSFHGFFLAGIAKLLGDRSPSNKHFFTLNPFVHIKILNFATLFCIIYGANSLLGSSDIPQELIFLLLICLSYRWVIKNHTTSAILKYQRLNNILYSLATPISFLILGFFSFVLIKILNLNSLPDYAFFSIVEFLRSTIYASIFWGAVHCIPIPPFAAANIWYSLTPTSYHHTIDKLHQYDFIILLMIFLIPVCRMSFWLIVTTLRTTFENSFISILF